MSEVTVGGRMRACTAAGAALMLAIALPSASSARAAGISLPAAPATGLLGSVGSTLSGVGAALPSVGITVPSVGVTVPSIGITVPSVGVTVPGVTVSTPEVKVSTPEVKASTPEVGVSTPSSPSGGSTETPTGGGSSGGGSSGGGSGGGSGTSSPPTGTNATVASVSGAAAAKTPAGGSGASRTGSSVGAATGTRLTSKHSARGAGGTRGAGGVSATTPTPGGSSGGGALGARDASALHAATSHGATAKHASSPLESIGRHIPLPLPVPDWSKPIIALLLVLAIGFALRSRAAGRRARRLERQRVTLLRDVGAMQAALVPEVPARVGGLGVSVAYRPAAGPAAGGDFYDVFVPARGRVAIILGDVAGHGHRALTQAALTRYTLRAYLQTGMEPRAALALAGRVLADPQAEHYATVAVAVYDTREGRLTYASAGHPPPLVQGMRMREPLETCASPPVGWTVPTGRRQTTVSLAPGAVVCFFSDGLIEARCREDLLGRERVGELLASLGPRPDAEKLLAKVRSTALATPDDMAACILTPEMAVIGVRTHVEELEVDERALARGAAQRFLAECDVLAADLRPALERAGEIAAASGTALLRVELERAHPTVTVTAPSPPPRVDAPQGPPSPSPSPSPPPAPAGRPAEPSGVA